MTLTIGGPLTRGDFDEMAAMEALCYGEELITPAEEAWRWYETHPATTVAARSESGDDEAAPAGRERIAGFVNLFGVRAETLRALRAGTFNDADLTTEDVAGPGEVVGMLLSCIVVGERWRGRGLAYRLLHTAAAQYPKIAPDTPIVIDTATPAGADLARKLGFTPLRPTDHGTAVWERDWGGFVRAVEQQVGERATAADTRAGIVNERAVLR